jgi:hypothetical protein
MKNTLSAFAAVLIMLSPSLAAASMTADNFLHLNFKMTLDVAGYAFTYDACVKQGLINDPGPSGEDRLRAAIANGKLSIDFVSPEGVTPEQVTEQKVTAVDMTRDLVARQPIPVEADKCKSLLRKWPGIIHAYGME